MEFKTVLFYAFSVILVLAVLLMRQQAAQMGLLGALTIFFAGGLVAVAAAAAPLAAADAPRIPLGFRGPVARTKSQRLGLRGTIGHRVICRHPRSAQSLRLALDPVPGSVPRARDRP